MKKPPDLILSDALKMHQDAVAAFANAAEKVSAENWIASVDQQKWTAAQVTEHLTLVYDVLLAELEGGSGMRVVTNFWQKAIARSFFLPRMLKAGIFPAGARAPKETRPSTVRGNQQVAIAAFQQLGQTFQERVQDAYNTNPKTKLTHAYFGTFTLDSAVLLCTQHLRHHTKKLTTAGFSRH